MRRYAPRVASVPDGAYRCARAHVRPGPNEVFVKMGVVMRLAARRANPDYVAAQIVRAGRAHPSLCGRDHPGPPRREEIDTLMFAFTSVARIAERARDAAALPSVQGEGERGRGVVGNGGEAAALTTNVPVRSGSNARCTAPCFRLQPDDARRLVLSRWAAHRNVMQRPVARAKQRLLNEALSWGLKPLTWSSIKF